MALEIILKPCPFCGSNKVEFVKGQCVLPGAGIEDLCCVLCTKCGAKSGVARDRTHASVVWNRRATISCDGFDQVEEHKNCTVQIFKNSVTGDVSVGWRRNDERTS